MKKKLILFLFSILFLVSCGQTNKLSEDDYKWMPYKGDETLVFASNKGDTDTIFLLNKDTVLAYAEPQSVNGIKYEVVSVFCKHSDSNMPDGKHRYLKNNFLKIEKAKDNRAEISIRLSAKEAKFYRLSLIKIDSLRKESPSTVQTSVWQIR